MSKQSTETALECLNNLLFLPDHLLQHEELDEVEEDPGDVCDDVEQGYGYQHHRQVHLRFEPLFSENLKLIHRKYMGYICFGEVYQHPPKRNRP